MKKIVAFFILLLSVNARAVVKISGTIYGIKEQYLLYTLPLDGFCNIMVNEKLNLNPVETVKRFNFSINVNSPVFLKLEVENLPVWLLVDSGDSIDIEISIEKYKESINGLKINGSSNEAILLYNEMFVNPYNNFIKLNDIFTTGAAKKNNLVTLVKSIAENQILPFRKLYNEGKLTKPLFDLVQIKLTSSLFDLALRRMDESIKFKQENSLKERDSLKLLFFSTLNPLDSNLNKVVGSEFYQYQYADFLYKKHLRKYPIKTLEDSLIKFNEDTSFLLSKFFVPLLFIPDLRIRQNVWAKWLYMGAESFKDKLYTGDYGLFKKFFPLSEYNNVFTKIEKENTAWMDQQLSNDSLHSNIIVLKNGSKIKTINELRSLIPGSYVYLDIWATWCMPCRQEFLSSKLSDSLLMKYKITKAFICIDEKAVNEREWKRIIYKYKLNGYNLIGGAALLKELKFKIFKSKNEILIPRYFFMDYKGNIIDSDAPKPSDHDGILRLLRKNKIIDN
jgi:thiol-disulfide isomerase/thioredoxin